RDPAAQRRADDMNALEIERIQEIEIEEGEVADILEPVGRVGPAEARVIRCQYLEALRQTLERRDLRRQALHAVQEEQGRALAAAAQMKPDAANLDPAFVHEAPSSRHFGRHGSGAPRARTGLKPGGAKGRPTH